MAKAARNLTGERFGKLVGIKDVGSEYGRGRLWRFRCDCGKEVTLPAFMVSGSRGHRSCGCGKRTGDLKRSPPYRHWKAMRQRCTSHRHYAGRGIQVCAEWADPLAFIEWALANGFEVGLSLDRIDNDGDYTPDNCRWATAKQQSVNKRVTVMVEWRGRPLALIEACAEAGVNYWTVRSRLKAGKSLEQALGTDGAAISKGPVLRGK
ncbi:MAG: hypothetical protein V4696_10390 [Pseudomonadota bacterium]